MGVYNCKLVSVPGVNDYDYLLPSPQYSGLVSVFGQANVYGGINELSGWCVPRCSCDRALFDECLTRLLSAFR